MHVTDMEVVNICNRYTQAKYDPYIMVLHGFKISTQCKNWM